MTLGSAPRPALAQFAICLGGWCDRPTVVGLSLFLLALFPSQWGPAGNGQARLLAFEVQNARATPQHAGAAAATRRSAASLSVGPAGMAGTRERGLADDRPM